MSYSELLKDPRWQRRRLTIMERDHFRCRLCHHNEFTLAVHHIAYSGKPWEAPDEDLITVCEHCHELVKHCKTDEQRRSFGIILRGANLIGHAFANNYDYSDHPMWLLETPNPSKDMPHIGHYLTGMYRDCTRAPALDAPAWKDPE